MTHIIEVKNLSKKYNITHMRGGYVALRDVMANIAKKPFSFIKNKTKKIIGREIKEDFWALKDVNFTVEKGEAIGIIGANGAGKSTLLKILSKITPPTTGEIRFRGRISSLLEVGTGFHPELTGRENILLNGAILGMTQKEIIRKFDDIVKFSGVEKFIDTPVKRYSSGMYVRLAFAVAAHMEPDILIVDEVLAVGDAEFQKKCLGKMDEVTKTAGRTVLFVSHNMSAIQKLCKRTILLENGRVKKIGPTAEVIETYLSGNPITQNEGSLKMRRDRRGLGNIRLTSFFVESEGKKVNHLVSAGKYVFCAGYETTDGKPAKEVKMVFAIATEKGNPLIFINTELTKQNFKSIPPKGIIRCAINQKFPLTEGIYHIAADIFSQGEREDFIRDLGVFEVKKGDFYGKGVTSEHSPIYLEQDWSVKENIPDGK